MWWKDATSPMDLRNLVHEKLLHDYNNYFLAAIYMVLFVYLFYWAYGQKLSNRLKYTANPTKT